MLAIATRSVESNHIIIKARLESDTKLSDGMYNENEGYSAAQSMSESQQPRPPIHAQEKKQEPSSINREDTQPPVKTNTGWLSEGGHDFSKIQPLAAHRGESVATFFNGLFKTIIAIATLGTSITFNYVLSNTGEPPIDGSRFDAASVQFFLALSWLFFLLALAAASLGSTLLTFFKKHWIHDWDGEYGKRSQLSVQLYAVSISGLMGGLVVAAFILLCLVVVAYQPIVGWISLGFTSLFGIIVSISVFNQTPWPWVEGRKARRNRADRMESV